MDGFLSATFAALWLGILTSISPCPLATNVAALSFIGRRVDRPGLILLAGILYTAGRVATYVGLGTLIIASIFSIPQVSHFLQEYMNKILGPILILVGLVLLQLIRFPVFGSVVGEGMNRRVTSWGTWGAAILGFVFALSFCPISAALFFGSLIPLSMRYESTVLLPLFYGLGTGLPVLLFAVLIGLGIQRISQAFSKLSHVEIWSRRVTGYIFILVGIYLSLRYVFHILP